MENLWTMAEQKEKYDQATSPCVRSAALVNQLNYHREETYHSRQPYTLGADYWAAAEPPG